MIYGHEENRKQLQEKLKEGSLPPTMIFCGPKGIGKGLVADELWKSEFDGEVNEDAVTVFRIEPKETGLGIISIKDIRKNESNPGLREWAVLEAPEGLHKWCLISDAHKFKDEAANALLKLIETPPANTIFIFLTDSYDQILPTIKSRMVQVEFQPLPREAVEKIGEELGFKDPRWIEFNKGAVEYPDQASFEKALVQFEAWCSLLNGTGMISREGSCIVPVKEPKGLAESEQLRKPLKMLQRILEDGASKKLGLPLNFESFKEKIPAFQDEVSRRTNKALSNIHRNPNSKLLLYYILQGLK